MLMASSMTQCLTVSLGNTGLSYDPLLLPTISTFEDHCCLRKRFEEVLAKQEGLMRQIKKLQKEAGREQKGPITETFAQRQFTFYQVRAKSFLGLKTAKAQESKYHLSMPVLIRTER